MALRFDDTRDIPLGYAAADWDSHGISRGRLMRLFPQLSTEQLVSVAGDAFLVTHRRTRRFSSAPSPTALTDTCKPSDTGETTMVVYPLMRRPESDRAVVCIGRLDGNDVALVDPTVSKYHAFVRVENGVYVIQDANSRNGTFVDSTAVPRRGAGAPVPLRLRCTVRFASVVTTFLDAATVVALCTEPG